MYKEGKVTLEQEQSSSGNSQPALQMHWKWGTPSALRPGEKHRPAGIVEVNMALNSGEIGAQFQSTCC